MFFPLSAMVDHTAPPKEHGWKAPEIKIETACAVALAIGIILVAYRLSNTPDALWRGAQNFYDKAQKSCHRFFYEPETKASLARGEQGMDTLQVQIDGLRAHAERRDKERDAVFAQSQSRVKVLEETVAILMAQLARVEGATQILEQGYAQLDQSVHAYTQECAACMQKVSQALDYKAQTHT